MDKHFLTIILLINAVTMFGFTYGGKTITENTEFTRSQAGTTNKSDIKEVSGLACSRVTPGYLWAEGDEDNAAIYALDASTGSKKLKLTLNGLSDRDDWEDIAIGEVNGVSTVFIGAFGDNDLQYNDNYLIYYFNEPAISGSSAKVTVKTITFGFPDKVAHNLETLMFDPIDQMFYIVDKVKDAVCTIYSLPFSTSYSGVQRLTKICELGKGEEFAFITAGDITPDGQWMIIKNKTDALLWHRQNNESLSATVQRQPEHIQAYEEEEQGESVAWLDATTFYTTSDSKKNTPIYKYVRKAPETPTGITDQTVQPVAVKRIVNGQLVIERDGRTYDLLGR